MSRGCLVGIVAFTLLAGVACEDDAASPAGEAGAAGASGASGAPEHGGSGAAGTPGSCEGDEDAWASLTAAPPPCETADDCCVVVNTCLAEARIVHAAEFELAQVAWPYCDEECVDCIAPVVVVACDNGHCVGSVDAESAGDSVSHCGDTADMAGSLGQSFTCDGG